MEVRRGGRGEGELEGKGVGGMCGRIVRRRCGEADITKWIEYFVEGMAISFENVLKRMDEAKTQGSPDQSPLLRKLDPRMRKALELFKEFETITSRQIGELFGFKPRTSTSLCADWVESGFLTVVDASNKGRKYKLSAKFQKLFN